MMDSLELLDDRVRPDLRELMGYPDCLDRKESPLS